MAPDQEIVQKILNGDRRAIYWFYRQAQSRLKPYFINHVAAPEDYEELMQDTFLHFLDALPLFHFQSSLLTFITSIAHHELADYWRKKYAKRLIRTIPILKNLIAPVQTSAKTALYFHHALEHTYHHIKPQYAELLRLKYEDSLSVKEIASKLGWSVKSVECQLYRARKAFQLAYEEQYS
jgi:RNA polymerase sigma-70 factor (ECF subfamily)